MERELDPCQRAERSLQKRFRKTLWTPFIAAVKRYRLVEPGDRVAACVSGGAASMAMAKLLERLARYGGAPFELAFIALDPGTDPEARRALEAGAALLRLSLRVFEGPATRGGLCRQARALGCNKVALGQHLDDAVEAALTAMLWGGALRGLPPRERPPRCPGVELIRPLYLARRADLLAWQRYNGLSLASCAPPAERPGRLAARRLLAELERTDPDVGRRLSSALHAASAGMFPGWRFLGESHSFLENYGDPEARPGPRGPEL